MSRFQNLLKNPIREKKGSSELTISPSRSLGVKKEFNIVTQGPYTESKYPCTSILCSGDIDTCEQVIVNYIEPEYDMKVGLSMSFPPELVFTKLEGILEEGVAPFWGRHALAIGKMYCFKCPSCGFTNKYTLCRDGGILLPSQFLARGEIQIPKDRVMYTTTPKEGWELEEEHMKM